MSETLVNWDEIDALSAAEQNERVVRLAVPSAYQHVSLCKIWKTAGDRIIWRNATLKNQPAAIAAGSLGNTWREARQHPTVATFETRSRAAWEAHKAAHVSIAANKDIQDDDAPESDDDPGRAVAGGGERLCWACFVWPKNTLECVICGKPHSGLVLTPRQPEQTASTSTEAGETLTDQPEPVKQVDTSQTEQAGEVPLPERDRFEENPKKECPMCKAAWGLHSEWQKGYCQGRAVERNAPAPPQSAGSQAREVALSIEQIAEHSQLVAALRDQVAKLTAERNDYQQGMNNTLDLCSDALSERDEARAKAAELQAALNRAERDIQWMDDARAELERLKGQMETATEQIMQDVQEMDRDGPEGQPNMMQITVPELLLILDRYLLPAPNPETEKSGGAE